MARVHTAILVSIALGFLGLVAPSLEAGVRFTAKSRSSSTGLDLAALSNASVRGWADGPHGRVEFLGEKGDAFGEGSVLFTEDAGASVWYFDSVRSSCQAWPGAAPGEGASGAGRVENLTAQKLTEEEGPSVAGFPTRHYRFGIAWDTVVAVSGKQQRWRTETTEDVWSAADVAEPALGIWLHSRARPTGDADADRQVAELLAEVTGTPLKRETLLRIDRGARTLETRVVLEVGELERIDVPSSVFEKPFACRASLPADSR